MATIVKSFNLPQVGTASTDGTVVKGFTIPLDNVKAANTAVRVRTLSIPIPFYCITVLDADNNPVEAALIKVKFTNEIFEREKEYLTDVNGKAFIRFISGNITIEKITFETFSTSFTFVGLDDGECIVYNLVTLNSVFNPPINEFNFLRWHQMNYDIPVPTSQKFQCTSTTYEDILNPFANLEKKYFPVFVKGEQFFFYCNSDEYIIDSTFPNWRLGLVKINILDDIGTFNIDFVVPIIDNLFPDRKSLAEPNLFRFTLAADALPTMPNVEDGLYQFLIWDVNTNRTKFISNIFFVTDEANAKLISNKVEYENSYNIYNYNYEGQALVIPNSYRLHIFQEGYEYDIKREQYRAEATGKLRNIKSEPDKSVNFVAHKFDEPANDALVAMLEHDSITISGQTIEPNGGVEVEQNKISRANTSKFKAFIQRFSAINRKC